MAEVRLAFDLAHPSGRVWRALTDAQLLCEWFMPTDLTPRAGSRFTFHPGTLPGFLGPVTGEVVAVEPASRLVMLWQGEKLYTRVTWDLAPVGAACRLSLTQTGFIGAPAALRCEGLTTTYRDLFGVQLPLALDRLAAEESGAGAGFASGESTASPRAPALRAAPPRAPAAPLVGSRSELVRRRLSGNARVRVWTVGPGRGAPQNTSPARTAPAVPATRPGLRRGAARWAAVSAVLPAASNWARSLAIGGAAATLAAVVFASLAYHQDVGPGGSPPGGPQAEGPAGPGMAVQPTAATPRGDPPGSPGPASGAESVAPARPGGDVVAPATPHVPPPVTTGGEAPSDQSPPTSATAAPSAPAPPVEPSPSPTPTPAPELTATVVSTGLPLVGGRSVRVTVANQGPGPAQEWEVVMSVSSQDVTNVTGVDYVHSDEQVTFTPSGGELGAGATTEFTFHLHAPVLGLLGASDPASCTINGQPCG